MHWDLGFKNHKVFGNCGELNVLLNDKIPTTLITYSPVFVTLFAMSGSEMLRMTDQSDVYELERTMRSVKCEDSRVVGKILNDLRSLSSSTSSSTIVRSHDCGWNEWSVMRCGGSSSLVLCLNCTDRTSNTGRNYCEASMTTLQSSEFPFSISCLDLSSDEDGNLSMLYLEFNELSPPPSFLSTEVVSVTDTSISVHVVMSDSGYLVCGAYLDSLSSSSSPSTSEMLLLGGVPVTSVPSVSSSQISPPSATYSLVGLNPSSAYNIYCTSLSPTSVPMSTVEMLRSKMSVRTSCCRLLSVRLNKLVVDDVSVLGFALTLDVGSEKVGNLLAVSISGVETNSFVTREMFVPSVVTLTSSSALKFDLTYIPLMSGSYRLNISLTGPSRVDYQVIFPAGDVLIVKGLEDVLPPPLVYRLEFSSDGSKIIVAFSSPTNRGGVLNVIQCGLLFESLSSISPSLPPTSRCVWTSDSSLEITSIGSSLEVGDKLLLMKGVLKACCTSKVDPSCSSWNSNEPQTITLTVPQVVMSPVVTLSIPSEIGPCDDLVVDATSSSGSGGRLWKSVSFVVGGLSPNITVAQDFVALLSTNPSSVRSPVVIPNGILSSGYAYTLEVKLCNFLNGCGSKLKSFVVSSSMNVPVVVLNTRNVITITRNSSLLISGDAYTTVCGGGKSSDSLTYSWSLSLDRILILSSDLRSVSVNPREFKLPSYRLAVGSLYVLKLTVKHSKLMKSSSSSVQVFVKSGDLKCVLTGGEGGELGVRLDESLLLDLSGSYDTNEKLEDSQSLSFSLSCFQTAPFYRDGCDSLILAPVTSSSSQFLVNVNSSSGVTTNAKFKIMFRGVSMKFGDDRSCEKVLELSILDSLAPVLRLEVLSGSKMNPSSKLKIMGTVDMKSSGVVTWSVNDDSISSILSSVSLSPLSRLLPSSVSGSPNVVSLVIVGNSLPQQSTFIFTLSCFLDNGYSSSTSITITTNSPPFGGVLKVRPVVGVMLETMFSMMSIDWMDEDLPLSYQFGYITSTSSLSPTNDITIFRSKLELSYTSTLLPSGPPDVSGTNSNLTCVVFVFDSLDSFDQSSFGVLVKEVKMSVDSLSDFLLGGINGSSLGSNSDDLKNILSSTSTVLNRVNCSNAPDCGSLNREDCSLLEGTCGECLLGHAGLLGFSNTPCLPIDDRRLLLSHSPASSSLSTCFSDVDCISVSPFLECNLQSNICQSIQQSCPNSCSGHGACLFLSKSDPSVTLPGCGMLDEDCAQVCQCDEDYFSSSCSLTREDFFKQMNLRHVILENVGELMSKENADRSNVMSWMKSLSSVGSDYSSLSGSSKQLMTSLTIDVLTISAELGLSIEDIFQSGMEKVVDMCVSGLSMSLSSSSDDDVNSASLLSSLLKVYSVFVTSDMSHDQYPVSSITPNFRSSSISLSTSSTSGLLSIPQTTLESMKSTNQRSVVELSSGLHYPLQLSVSELQPTTANSILTNRSNVTRNDNHSQLSLPVVISFGSRPCSSLANGVGCVVRVTLQNKYQATTLASPSYLESDLHPYFEVECVLGQNEDHEFMCPTGDSLLISCNGSFAGKGRRMCPMRSSLIDCKTIVTSSLSSPVGDVSCELSPESNVSTSICVCDLSKVAENSGPVSFSILSMEKSVVTEFASTWETAAALSASDVVESWLVLVTVGSIGGLSTLFVLLGIQYDFYQKKKLSIAKMASSQHKDQVSSRKPRKAKSILFVGVPESQREVRVKEDMKLIEESLPSIFKTNSLWSKVKEEMKVYHRWLGIIFFYSPAFPRSMRVLSLFSSITIMLFIQSVTYNIADPDDGSCEGCESESCCLSMKSTLNSNEDKCYWVPLGVRITNTTSLSLSSNGSCHFRDIGEDMTRMFIVAMVSATLSAPLALSLQYLIANVLSKECVSGEDLEKEKQQSQLNRTQRLMSSRLMNIKAGDSKSTELVERCGESSPEVLKNLLKELSQYYNELVANKRVDKAKEFRGSFDFYSFLISPLRFVAKLCTDAWGSLVKDKSENTSKDLKVFTRATQLISNLSKSDPQHEEVMKDLIEELAVVREEVFQEYHRLKGLEGVDKLNPHNEEIDLLMKRKRLIYLFVKDMSSGVSGDELSSKAQRDSQMSVSMNLDRVSWEAKWSSWLFVILLDGGMLIYIYLFAMNQTHSRQSAWFQSFVMWLLFEIFVSSTSLVLVLHLFIPLYVWTDVSKLKKKVLGDLIEFREKLSKKEVKERESQKEDEDVELLVERENETEKQEEFNAAKFLYPSWRVAAMFPELPESKLILQFSTPWPKKRFGGEAGNVAKEYEDDIILTAASRIMLYFLTSLLHTSTLLQDIMVQFVCNGGLGYLSLLFLRLWSFSPWLSVVAVVALFLCLHFLFRVSSGGLVKKLSGGNDKLIYPDTSVPTPVASSPKPSLPSISPTPKAEGSEDDSLEGISLGDIPASDSSLDNSSGVPSLGCYFVFDVQSSDSASGSSQSQGSCIDDQDDNNSSPPSSESDGVEKWYDGGWE
jgi:hypothetical protein